MTNIEQGLGICLRRNYQGMRPETLLAHVHPTHFVANEVFVMASMREK